MVELKQIKIGFVVMSVMCLAILYLYRSTGLTANWTSAANYTIRIFKDPVRNPDPYEELLLNVKVKHIDCAKLILQDPTEVEKAEYYHGNVTKVPLGPSYFLKRTENCESFVKDFHFTTQTLSDEARLFPIAYSLLVFKDIEQIFRLLRAIYRPENYYCFHVDVKADANFTHAIGNITKCFNNVFVSSTSVDVKWGRFSILEPELICMEDLWKYKTWKYFINLTGQEFPLQTNEELVEILRVMQGANLVGATIKHRNKGRFKKAEKDPPPKNMTLVKGSVHVAVKRDFVDYVLHNETALQFREWVKDIGVPDEAFFNVLSHNPQLGIPGAYKGVPEIDRDPTKTLYPFLTRYKVWTQSECHGKRVRTICIFGVGDLPLLSQRKELFANKFHQTYEPLAYDCLEELHFNKTRESRLGLRTFNTSYYANLDVVTNHVN